MLHDPPTSPYCPHPHDPSTSSHCPHPHDPPTSSHRHNNLAMPRRPKGPAHRPASATSSLPPQPSLHPSLPPTHSAGETAGTDRLGGGSWLPLGSQENALEARGHLSEQRKLRVVSSGLRPWHFSGSLEEPSRNPVKCPRPQSHRRVPPATIKFRNQTTTTDSTPEVPSRSPVPPSDRRSSY